MRLFILVCSFVLLLSSRAATAQSWFEYTSLEDRFGVNFPAEPEIEAFEYESEFQAIFPARSYRAERGPDLYVVTVVDFTDAQRIHGEMDKTEAASGSNVWINDQRASVARAAREFRARGGQITYDAWSHIDLVEGHQLQLTNADGTRTYAAMYFNGNSRRLYVLEATISPRSPPAGQFQQSLRFLDEDGDRVRYRLSPNGCSVPPDA
ncbi:MAG: hypothetical protein OEQ25_04230 [Gammaproteobacteria bacterium]|nr:hypothetical protein [Gammaproteobacteria bacterium]MDH3506328.1 hypothetical protein [Gammaproteobacteria bacterium]